MELIIFPLFRLKSTYIIPFSSLQKGSLYKTDVTSRITAAFPRNYAEDARQARAMSSHRMRAVLCSALLYKASISSFRHIQGLNETRPRVMPV